MKLIQYRDIQPYKYMLSKEFSCVVPESLRPKVSISICDENGTPRIRLTPAGTLFIHAGYIWDGASGPTLDDGSNMVPALQHDAFYQLMREGLLPQSWRKPVDEYFYEMLKVHGMGTFRAWYYYRSVRMFGGKSARRQNDGKYKIYHA